MTSVSERPRSIINSTTMSNPLPLPTISSFDDNEGSVVAADPQADAATAATAAVGDGEEDIGFVDDDDQPRTPPSEKSRFVEEKEEEEEEEAIRR